MNEEYYSDDDYDQEYAEGYSAYKYDNEDYDFGDEDDPEYAEEENIDEYIDDCVDDAATKRRQQQALQGTQHEASQSTYATAWDKKMDGCMTQGCAFIVAAAIIIFFIWCLC